MAYNRFNRNDERDVPFNPKDKRRERWDKKKNDRKKNKEDPYSYSSNDVDDDLDYDYLDIE